MKTPEKGGGCLGIGCVWYDPGEVECTAAYETWKKCRLREKDTDSAAYA